MVIMQTEVRWVCLYIIMAEEPAQPCLQFMNTLAVLGSQTHLPGRLSSFALVFEEDSLGPQLKPKIPTQFIPSLCSVRI